MQLVFALYALDFFKHFTQQKVLLQLSINNSLELNENPLCDDDDNVSECHSKNGMLFSTVLLSLEEQISALRYPSWQPAPQAPGMDNCKLHAKHDIFAYLKKYDSHRPQVVLGAAHPSNIEQSLSDWADFYKDIKEKIQQEDQEPLGKSVEMTSCMDYDHAGDKVTRKCRNMVLIILNRSSIL